ncbi:PAS domain S-box-containing protein [Caldanaerovirga acetigignens]|uniref:PAS domain S-box-containing protein n=1 Tax=Caldanaerovirga acetigignens TaxID=447595 RepID=A0A1M7HHF5_9FIRM|nr:sigma 54-interacting transcriptional regulator [Caldanaerovirga acetigignens]SHM27935.1 PAS domain S-box-containing protein [Caldanaerovirga acetigignens]
MPVKKSRDRPAGSPSYFEQILENLPDPIFLTDSEGNVLLSNSATAYSMGISLDQFLKSNLKELIKNGYYNFSYALQAAEKKEVVRGEITTCLGITYDTISTPVFDRKGNVIVVTCGTKRDKKNSSKNPDLDERQKREIDYLRSYVFNEEAIVAESKTMKRVLLTAHTAAQTDSVVLLCGETGTGKEVLAKYIHKHSKRAEGPFIAVNCAALPETLVESELFGYEKGAFTGSSEKGKIGLFEAANGGTLFLDEISELPLPQQAKLLRVLETKTIRRIGSSLERTVDFRLICATNKNLEKMVEEGTFRRDLFYRINVVTITIPPLRERPEDIVALSKMFVEHFNKKYGTDFKLDPDTIKSYLEYDWPGNVRELRNVIERSVIINMNKYNEEDIPNIPDTPGKDLLQYDYVKLLGLSGTLKDVLKKVEKMYIRHVLSESGGKVGVTAKKLGIFRTVLYRKLKEYGIEKKEFKG